MFHCEEGMSAAVECERQSEKQFNLSWTLTSVPSSQQTDSQRSHSDDGNRDVMVFLIPTTQRRSTLFESSLPLVEKTQQENRNDTSACALI